ncbi:hypothetical protein EJ110_NYTH27314 [Nymphaea thermarum]|nr:hypothetical protein EJ110_NYTH27314 [Nymphaea thermarum]
MYFDGAKNVMGASISILLITLEDEMISYSFKFDFPLSFTRRRCCHRRHFRRHRRHYLSAASSCDAAVTALAAAPSICSLTSPPPTPCSLPSSSAPSPSGSTLLPWCPPLSPVLLLFYRRSCPLSTWSEIMAASSSPTVKTNQTEIGAYRSKNVLVQVITLRLTKENYFSWSAAMTMGIAGRGRIAYIDGRNPEPARTSGVCDTWFLEDNQILNSGEVPSMEDVYSCMEVEEQRRLVTTEGKRDLMPYHERSALVSRGPGGSIRSLRRCTHCKKTEKKGNKRKSSIGKMLVSEVPKSSGEKVSISANQIHEPRAYLGWISVNQGVTLELRRKASVCLDRSTPDEVLGQMR